MALNMSEIFKMEKNTVMANLLHLLGKIMLENGRSIKEMVKIKYYSIPFFFLGKGRTK